MTNYLKEDAIRRVVFSELSKLDMPEQDAKYLVEGLLHSSMRGIDTHGIALLPTYLEELRGGRSRTKPNLQWQQPLPCCLKLDADGANGVVAASHAMLRAIEVASVYGVAVVSVRNSNHFAAASIYTHMAAERDMIGICLSNSDALVGLENGKEPFLGTNPIAMTASGAGGELFDLDFATSQVSYSKVRRHLNEGKPIPSGWAKDAEGNDTSCTNEFHALEALGGYKGQGIGFMVQILTSVLADTPFDNQLSHLYCEPYDSPRNIAHTMVVLSPAMFDPTNGSVDGFKSRLSGLMATAREQGDGVTLPGDKERQCKSARAQSGIPVSPEFYNWFLELSETN
ncbi:Ldh family oxidoreductase [Pseudoalteromonas luteoviolacea]|uniref:Malate dehydrogenase n=1 Tax=Pseudoalteromonas luteoviolacea S4054 TaxID=1129367 RepID=A0A0F6ABZ6_9GAMM|nr:Ldh family oxidoreductase [Pseudoalteromonas luteoviolacea]AOT10646.1 hypothetical protein S4054249_22565 [Pseudoalteromonas luteoviolacea]AOT15286.1 hypothetical protein S40542_21030 [Pseudoalteromonas luteoviolacea]AOT20465.1 hypothetical protein S4054_22480 [Pseudoalteromonas luteoviolacea]KKE83747.1 hypothetical protein N479_13040 [Pseudoalteromonas luteoviolacea S4054]KZN71951.1 hypothetical protein N481_17405 [Pseudoalteromonas luteoviolacea S4047-1]